MKRIDIIKKISFGIAIFGLLITTSCKEAEQTENEVNTSTEADTETQDSVAGDEVALNPAHGMPNHRCDIPVGAPLNSASSTQQSTTNASSNVSPLRVDKTPRINPAHGEPGHSCSVPVGAPLE